MVSLDFFAQNVDQGRFRPVGDDFDRVDEVFAAVGQLSKPVCLWKLGEGDFTILFPPLPFELGHSSCLLLDFFLESLLAAQKLFHIVGFNLALEDQGSEIALLARQQGPLPTHLAVQSAPVGVDHLHGIRHQLKLIIQGGIRLELLWGGLVGNVSFQAGDDLLADHFNHARIDRLVDLKDGTALRLVDPVIGRGAAAWSASRGRPEHGRRPDTTVPQSLVAGSRLASNPGLWRSAKLSRVCSDKLSQRLEAEGAASSFQGVD
jgi:hypothetical protein